MGQKFHVSEFMKGGRIVSHGKISDLSGGFKLPGGQLFSVYVRPKASTEALDTVLAVRCCQDEEFSEAPVPYNDWTPLAIAEIAADADILNDHDIYWGSGSYIGSKP